MHLLSFIVLTGVSGSSENRFNLSSLLAERIPSSVSAIYCETAERQKDTVKDQLDANHKMFIMTYEIGKKKNKKNMKAFCFCFYYDLCFNSLWSVHVHDV